MTGRRPNHPELAMIVLIKKLGYREGKYKKIYIKWNKRSLKRRKIFDAGDFYANAVWGPFKGGGPYEMDLAFPNDKLDIEIDGVAWHNGLKQLKDEVRDSVLRNAGWTVTRITDEQVYRVFVPLINKVNKK